MSNTMTIDELKQQEDFIAFRERATRLLKHGVQISYLTPEEKQAYRDRDIAEANEKASKKLAMEEQERKYIEQLVAKKGFRIV